MRIFAAATALAVSIGCARTWINYPPQVVNGRDGVSRSVASRAIELNGSDALGATEIEVTRGGVRFASSGGIDNSTSTKAGYRTVRHAVTTAGTVAGIAIPAMAASSAYRAEQAAAATSSAAASKSAASQAATSSATTVRLAEIQAAKEAAAAAVPAAGSTIQSTIPATVVPIP